VPGGRFREFYYWDSLWTVEGMLHSGMINSSLNMVHNFVHFINKYGYIPNGARVYFLGRS
jgi:alpha,alpha-trehalase